MLAALGWVLVCLGAALALGHLGEGPSRLQTAFWILAALGVMFLFQQVGILLLAHTIGTRVLLVILLPVVLGYGLWRIFTFLADG
ncbi:MAG: hypothetical protein JJT81_19720 [Rubellimicrobium sp.]|nr:hypothetical protein [Rubellimicrobium sp.]